MAANNGGGDSTGKKFYYNIAFGMLSANAKDAPEGYEKTSLSDIKSRRKKNENVDLRNKYYDKENGKDYPLRVFYTDIDGIIESVQKDEYDQGVSLKVTLHDEDGDESILQTDFYGKVSADFLNRLLNVNPENQLNFRPYSIPTEWEINGEKIKGYSSGVSIKDNGTKIERAFKGKDSGLPRTEQITNSQGKKETSRVAQINFLWEKVSTKFAAVNADSGNTVQAPKESTPAPQSENAPAETAATSTGSGGVDKSDLPF